MHIKYQKTLTNQKLSSPFFVYDEQIIKFNVQVAIDIKNSPNVLFPLKPIVIYNLLEIIENDIKGLSVSSLFEAKLANEVIGKASSIHYTTPGLKPEEIEELVEICDYITFNSLPQWDRFRYQAIGKVKCGLRINPQLSVVEDQRYDPCRKHSKLGVPIDQLITTINNRPDTLQGISGIHFHTNCDSDDFSPLLKTVKHLDSEIPSLLEKIEWINMGGGYLFDDPVNLDAFHQAVDLLKSKYGLEIFIEPGAAIVRSAGYIVSSVLDMFESDRKTIAVLDTTVNHMPEVFEYQYRPEVQGDVKGEKYSYILAGCSCLAGDVFGEYTFDEPLEVGSRVVFLNMGAYTLVKAHMFNGINLPTIYSLNTDGELEEIKRFGYEDFLSRCGVNNSVIA